MPVQRFNPKVSMVGRSGISPLSKSLRMSVRDKFGNTMTKTQFEKFIRSDPKLKVLTRKNGTIESWVGAKHTGAFFKKIHEEGGRFVIKPKVKQEIVYKGKVSDRAVKSFYLGVKKEEVAANAPKGPTPEEKMKALKLQKIKEGFKRIRQFERADEIRKQPNLGEIGAHTSAAAAQREQQQGTKDGGKNPQKPQPVSAPMPFAGSSIHSQTAPANAPQRGPQVSLPQEQGQGLPQTSSPSLDENTPQKTEFVPQSDKSTDEPQSAPPVDPDIG